MVVAGLAAAAPSTPLRPRRVATVALTTSPPSSSRAWRKHSTGGFVGFPLSNLSLPPRLITRSGREDARTGAAARLPSPRCWARRCGGSPPFLHRRRRSITGAAGLAVCYCGVAGEPRCRRWRTLPVRVLFEVSVLFEFRGYCGHCLLVSVVVIRIRRRCRLRWLLGCRRAGSETAAVSVQSFLLRFELLRLLQKWLEAEVLVLVCSV